MSNDYGKAPHELEQVLEDQANTEERYHKIGYIILDATQPLDVIVDEISKYVV
jgi:hypothetical protein